MSAESKKEELSLVSMEIILHAGDAKALVDEALDDVSKFNLIEAKKKMELAEKEIVLAHSAQTNLVQSEASGEEYPNSMLFNHAQDTLMNAMNYKSMAEKMISILEALLNKIEK